MRRLNIKEGHTVQIPTEPGAPEQVHVFSDDEILAVNAALAARRALLVLGEPGTGKTQLAKATALALGRGFVPSTVDSRTEARDLLWYFDAVARLAEAQVQGALARGNQADKVREALAIERFIQPRPLWWGFDWAGAEVQAKTIGLTPPGQPEGSDVRKGLVVLIDEIDKAESDVPNGLLEALGAGEFTPQGFDQPVTIKGEAPLVIVTTNQERILPDAFLRRCIVLYLRLPDVVDDREGFTRHLIERGARHFPELHPRVLTEAAHQVALDRARAQRENWLPKPGQAEYIDLLRAARDLATTPAAQEAELKRVKNFVLRKHPDAALAATEASAETAATP